jgi:hypothetical protein
LGSLGSLVSFIHQWGLLSGFGRSPFGRLAVRRLAVAGQHDNPTPVLLFGQHNMRDKRKYDWDYSRKTSLTAEHFMHFMQKQEAFLSAKFDRIPSAGNFLSERL